MYWELPEQSLKELLGADSESLLHFPWWYWFPLGLILFALLGVLIAIGIIFVVALMLRGYWLNRLNKYYRSLADDERYVAAMKKYLEQLPSTGTPTKAQHQAGLQAGVNHLLALGVKASHGRRRLLGLLQVSAKDRIDDLNNKAHEYTETGRWSGALQLYQTTVDIAYHLDPTALKLALGNVAWCQREMNTAKAKLLPMIGEAEM